MESKDWTVDGFRSVGVGHTPLTKLCSFLNMPPPMTKNAYNDTWTEPTADAGSSVDDVWPRKGFSSTFGVVPAISADNGKVLDVAIHSFLNIMELLKIQVTWQCVVDLPIYVANVHPFIGRWNHRKCLGRCCIIPKQSRKTKTLKLKECQMKSEAFKTQY